MGQRTGIILELHDRNGKKDVRCFHNQWGIGRVMYEIIMWLVTEVRLGNLKYQYFGKNKVKTNFFSRFKNLPDCIFLQDSEVDSEFNKARRKFSHRDFNSVCDLSRFFDNNNGYMVVVIKERGKDYFYTPYIEKVGFLLGYEDSDNPLERWVSPEEYGAINGGSGRSTPDYVKSVVDYLKMYNIEFL